MSNKTIHQLYIEHKGKISDKWTLYLNEYDRLFGDYRNKPIRLLEIGIQNGGSLEIWSKYFSNASVLIGVDINQGCARLSYDDPRISVIVGDANAPEVRERVFQRSPQFDIIIDDGSHLSSDIVKSFTLYFKHVVEGGIFIAEDLHCSYWSQFEGGLFDPYSSISFFKRLADIISHEHWGIPKLRTDILRGIFTKYGCGIDEESLAQVHSVEFINSMCVVRKAPPADNKLGSRFIAGSLEMVVSGHRELHGCPYQFDPSFDQSGNPWSARKTPPDEVKQIAKLAVFNGKQRITRSVRFVGRMIKRIKRALAEKSLQKQELLLPTTTRGPTLQRAQKQFLSSNGDQQKRTIKNKYTIFLPVHNGGEHVKQCIASILSQRIRNFELVILENASTDGTREWVQSLSDPRIILLSSDKLLPIHENWARAMAVPKREFMVLVGADDLLDNNYLEVMENLISREPNAKLYFAHFRYIDGEGSKIRSCRPIASCETATDYMSGLFTHKRDTYGTGYLYRSKDYDSVGGMPNWNHLLFADDALWISLMKGSWNATAREECFAVRVHSGSYGQKADWQYWVEGMRTYHNFLKGLANEDSTFRAALTRHAPKYFFGWVNNFYIKLVEQAEKSGRPIDPSDVLALKKILKETAPEFLPRLGFVRGDTRRRILKHFAFTRWLYQWYRHLRYDENMH